MAAERSRSSVPLTAWAVVDLDAVRENLRAIRGWVSAPTRILLTVKADAYGLGAVAVARVAEREKVEMLGVATLDEGIELREAGVGAPILILSPTLSEESELIVNSDLRVTVGSIEVARSISRAAVAAKKSAVVHVEVDTGMGRAGISVASAREFLRRLGELPAIEVEGIYTHFPVSNENDLAFTRDQTERFAALLDELKRAGMSVPLSHAANSAALLNTPDAHLQMVRPGLLAYGFAPFDPLPPALTVRPAMEFKTRVLQVREFAPGESISYGRTYFTKRPTRIALIAIGYGDGYSWSGSNRAFVLVGGRRAPIVGRVTMDTTMIDVTDLPDICPGDEVVLFGRQGEGRIRLEELARWQGTISYEVICLLGRRVARLYREAGRETWVRTMVGDGRPSPVGRVIDSS